MSQNRWLIWIVALSLLLHLLALWWLDHKWTLVEPQSPKKSDAVFVDLKNFKLPIVDSPKPVIEKKPLKPSAQGLYDQVVKEETVSPNSKPLTEAVGKKSAATPMTKPKPPESSSVPMPKPQSREVKVPGFPDTAPVTPSRGGEYLPNFKMGGRTYLNILANPQIFYFVEMKRKLQLAWSPQTAIRGGKSGEKIVVILAFSIASNGKLIYATVLRPSGSGTYDDEARRAVTVSAPFSPPPENLLKEGRLDLAIPFTTHFR